jgi:hypothetical protein
MAYSRPREVRGSKSPSSTKMEVAIEILNRECKYNSKWCRYRYKAKMQEIVTLGSKI